MDHTVTLDEVRLLFHEHLIASIVPFLATLLSGGLVALGIMCVALLSSKGQGKERQQRILQVYVVVVVSIVLGYQVEVLIELNQAAFQSSYTDYYDLKHVLDIAHSIFALVTITLTDGLLVWRCFMVQRALGPNRCKLQALLWITPMCFWGITIVAGFTVVGLHSVWRECTAPSWCYNSLSIAGSIAIISNVILNLFATCYIVIRLLSHRRKSIHLYGRQNSTSQCTCIISTLLESSAINVPIAITAMVQVYTTAIATSFLPFSIACQAFTSILIIHQVAIGRASRQSWDTQDEIDEERVHGKEPKIEPTPLRNNISKT